MFFAAAGVGFLSNLTDKFYNFTAAMEPLADGMRNGLLLDETL